MADSAKINEALGQLDTENDNHWTQSGEPRLETVRMLAGDQTISRADVDTATKDFTRQSARDAKAPPAPPAPPATDAASVPPAPAVVDAGAPGGILTGDPIQSVPAVPQPEIAVTPPYDADGSALPSDVPPLPTAPPADGLPTAAEPAMIEGGTPDERGQDAETPSADVEGSVEAGRPPQITEGTTEKGYNALATDESNLRDAQASTSPSPNAPEALGGDPGARSAGLTNEAGTDESTEQRPGEAQLSPVDRGAVGNANEVEDLEAQLAKVTAASDKLRGKVDDAQVALSESVAEESRLRVAIERARPRGGTMPAIQDYFAQLDATATKQAEARQAIADSGLDFGQLKKLVESPVTGDIK